MVRSISLFALLCSTMALMGGCGSSANRSVNPEAALGAAASRGIRSANVEGEVTIQVRGIDRLSSPVRLRVDGPYVAGGATSFPSFDWRASASALGFPVGGHLTSTGANVYLSVYGDDYQLGSAPPPVPAIDVRRWFGAARQVGDADEGGVDCARIRAPLRGGRAAADLAPVLTPLGLGEVAVHGTIDACVGFDDRLFHELRLDAQLTVPPQERAALGGASGAHLRGDLSLADVNKPQEIAAPAGAGSYRPVTDLLLTLNDLGVPIP
jgi:hypothetical protein